MRLLGAIILSLTLAAPVSAAPWTVLRSNDVDHVPDTCDPPSLMAENDTWLYVVDGSLAPGESLTFSHPRPTCWIYPVRLAWRWWLGHGRPPEGIALTITAPNGVSRTVSDIEVTEPGRDLGFGYIESGTLFDIMATKQGLPVWGRFCVEPVHTAEYAGTWTYTVTNIGTRTAVPLRVGAFMHLHEFNEMGCLTSDPTYTGYWWPDELSRDGL